MQDLVNYELQETSWRRLFQAMKHARHISIPQQKTIIDAFMLEVRARVKRYNLNRSTSLSTFQYKEIKRSMFYILDHSLPAYNQETYLMQTNLQIQLSIGEQEIEKQVDALTALWHRCKNIALTFPNERYHNILDEQIPKFLSGYDIAYHAHRCYEDLDYPLIDGLAMDHAMYHKRGIDVVYEYLMRFHLEQCYASQFQEQLPELIHRYEQVHGIAIGYMGLNVCSIVLPLHICTTILPTHTSLLFTEDAYTYIENHLDMLYKVAQSRLRQCMDETCFAYFENTIKDSIEQLIKVPKSTLSYLLLHASSLQKQVFNIPALSQASAFEDIYERIAAKATCAEKIIMIKELYLGLQDVIDLFENGIFYHEEYISYYQSCSPHELAVFLYLSKREEFAFHGIVQRKQLEQWRGEMEWEHYLYQYVSTCQLSIWVEIQTIFETTNFVFI